MKRVLLLSFLSFGWVLIFAQSNLVSNPSFEDSISCPTSPGDINLAVGWSSPYGTADYYHSCNTNNFGVPNNWLGSQSSKHGSAYSGIGVFVNGFQAREYIETTLLDTLQAGKKYCMRFYISLSDSSQYAISNLGVYFSPSGAGGNLSQILSYSPQINNPISNFLQNKTGWQMILDSFIAIGNERILTIGNFTDDQNTDTLFVGGTQPGSLYYIDDIWVGLCDSMVGIEDPVFYFFLNIYPNPSNGTFTVNCELKGREKIFLGIFDVLGNEVLTTELVNKETQINLLQPGLRSGIYFYMVKSEGKFSKSGKLILSTE